MPPTPTHPRVYVEEESSGVRTITGVATAVTAFVGRAPRGPIDSDAESPVRLTSYADYERRFGGLSNDSPLSFALFQYFNNGGSDALVVRVHNGAMPARSPNDDATWQFQAANPGEWGNALRVRIDYDVPEAVVRANAAGTMFNLRVKDLATLQAESFPNLSSTVGHPRFVSDVLAQQSSLLRGRGGRDARPDASDVPDPLPDDLFADASSMALAAGTDGDAISAGQFTGAGLRQARRGLYALEKADLFNLLVLPPFSDGPTDAADVDSATWSAAIAYATERRAMVLVDPPFHDRGWRAIDDLTPEAINGVAGRSANAALFFPRIRAANPLRENRLEPYAPAGAVAGVIARTDGQRGVWKSAGGVSATLIGVPALEVAVTDRGNALVNPLGVNCLRMFPNAGAVVWGSRTLLGTDSLASEWKYLAVRRTALFLEESLYRGTRWVVFEPNGEPLWAQIRRHVGAFLHQLFRDGAFQGATPSKAYFVRCDASTTTPTDIDAGIVNILVGFAPLKPAEFVLLRLQQRAGDPVA